MNTRHQLKRWIWVVLAVNLIISWCPGIGRAESSAVGPSDIEYSEPFELTARIMEIDYGKSMLIVAENEILVVDLMVGAEYIRTVLSDAHGNPVEFGSLDRGQTITVNGMKIPDGRVVAEELILQSSRSVLLHLSDQSFHK